MFGILALFWPGLTLLLLITLFSAYAIAGGVVAIVAAIRYRSTHASWWVPLLLGICSIGAGVIAALVPRITTLVLIAVIGANTLVWLIGVYALFTGALLFVLGISARAWHHDGLTGEPHAPLHP
ncbi:DUF308 domain-containing protein [Paraburkholderia kirstenboschensis]|uniref:DUF308 domain-containing protein n=1 Tax=Paraburkholderia kirstenboschensis TaxID=1245436 RepID=A0ABZ0EBS3_9BURK|nr:DUF308 domain-containing protein [Paraburkholderia kirstenboschensis]WOD14681.1 DUF308 domain-containing protein [Paraburkholderia kirstenboschensis]